jgi:hypothetical protein
MKRTLLTLALLLFMTSLAVSNASAQSLFEKKGGLSSAFGKPTSTPTSNGSGAFTAQDLQSYMNRQGLEKTQKLSDSVYKFSYKHEKWTFPGVLSISKDGSRIWLSFGLQSISKDTRPADCSEALLQLMSINGKYGEMFFRYRPESRLISCLSMIQVKGQVSDSEINTMILNLAKFASGTSKMWDTKTWADAPKHVGMWSSEQMQLALAKDGRFELRTRSGTNSGVYKIDTGRISMKDNAGEHIDGNIIFDGPNKFTLKINDSSIMFVRK